MKPPRLLVEDDNRVIRELWFDALTMLGCEVIMVVSGLVLFELLFGFAVTGGP